MALMRITSIVIKSIMITVIRMAMPIVNIQVTVKVIQNLYGNGITNSKKQHWQKQQQESLTIIKIIMVKMIVIIIVMSSSDNVNCNSIINYSNCYDQN